MYRKPVCLLSFLSSWVFMVQRKTRCYRRKMFVFLFFYMFNRFNSFWSGWFQSLHVSFCRKVGWRRQNLVYECIFIIPTNIHNSQGKLLIWNISNHPQCLLLHLFVFHWGHRHSCTHRQHHVSLCDLHWWVFILFLFFLVRSDFAVLFVYL